MKQNITSVLKIFSFHLIIVSILILPMFVTAQGGPVTPVTIRISNPFNCGGATAGNCTVMTLILAILNNIVMPIAAVAVTMWIIWAGLGFLMAQGKPAEIEKAKQRLLWSLIGAGILLGAVGIANVVENTVRTLIAP